MKNTQITVNLQYEETYQIKGKKLPRIRLAEKEITLSIPTFAVGELPVAFIVKEYKKETKYFYFDGNFYTKKELRLCEVIKNLQKKAKEKRYLNRVYDENLIYNKDTHFYPFDVCMENLSSRIENFISIGYEIYVITKEPCYTINMYGFEQKAYISISNFSNPINITREFSAMEKDFCVNVARTRGNEVIEEYCDIVVLMPETVTHINRERKTYRDRLNIVTFEQAEKLKKLGFFYSVNDYYYAKDIYIQEINHSDRLEQRNNKYTLSAPTVELALQWIRNEKYIFAKVDFSVGGYYWDYFAFADKTFCAGTECKFSSYESAANDLLDELLIAIEESEVANEQ